MGTWAGGWREALHSAGRSGEGWIFLGGGGLEGEGRAIFDRGGFTKLCVFGYLFLGRFGSPFWVQFGVNFGFLLWSLLMSLLITNLISILDHMFGPFWIHFWCFQWSSRASMGTWKPCKNHVFLRVLWPYQHSRGIRNCIRNLTKRCFIFKHKNSPKMNPKWTTKLNP